MTKKRCRNKNCDGEHLYEFDKFSSSSLDVDQIEKDYHNKKRKSLHMVLFMRERRRTKRSVADQEK